LQQNVSGAIFNDQFTVQCAGETILKIGQYLQPRYNVDSLLSWTTLCIYLQHTINMTDPHQDIILFISCS